MSSIIHSQEFEFSEVLDNREKVDVQLIKTLNPQQMEGAANMPWRMERDSLRSKSECDLRKSLAWDNAFFTSPGVLDPEELFETLNFRVVDSGVDVTGYSELNSLSSESMQSERTSGIGEYGVRKSLAWDSAFFTSEGVLNAEELSILHRGFKESETHLLPRIEEEVGSSVDSNSALNSICNSLKSLEFDLFGDIHGTIHNSCEVSSNGPTSTGKLRRAKRMQNGDASKMLHASCQGRTKPAAPSGESNPSLSLKPSKMSGHADPSSRGPKKRTSLGTNQVKIENKTTKPAPGKNIVVSNKTYLRNSCVIIPNSTASVKSPSSVLPTTTNHFAVASCAQSDFTGKSPSKPLRRTIDSQMAASVSTFRTPPKYSHGNKSELVNSSDLTGFLSMPQSSSCTSPAGSIDGWSSESTTSVNQRSNSSAVNLIATPCLGISFDIDASQASDPDGNYYGQPALGPERQQTSFMSPQMNKISVGTSPVPADVLGTITPSGLRKPSPKIGYFDEVNSMDLVLNRSVNFQSCSLLTSSKIGSGISNVDRAANKTKNGKHQLVEASRGNANKPGTKARRQVCIRMKQQPLKDHEDFQVHGPQNSAHGLDENNKENIHSEEIRLMT